MKKFEKWYRDEYEFSDRYWSKAVVRRSEDMASEKDDEVEIRRLNGLGEARMREWRGPRGMGGGL